LTASDDAAGFLRNVMQSSTDCYGQ